MFWVLGFGFWVAGDLTKAFCRSPPAHPPTCDITTLGAGVIRAAFASILSKAVAPEVKQVGSNPNC